MVGETRISRDVLPVTTILICGLYDCAYVRISARVKRIEGGGEREDFWGWDQARLWLQGDGGLEEGSLVGCRLVG